MARPTHIPRLVEQTRRRLRWPVFLKSYGPLVCWVFAFAILVLTGVVETAHSRVQAVSALVFHVGWVVLLIRGLRAWRKPTTEEARDIVDALDESRPASTIIDRPTRLEGETAAIWAEHRARVQEAAARLSAPSLWPQAQAADPLYLRFIGPALLIAAGVSAGATAPQRLMSGLDPDFGALVGADKLTVQAWVAPPGYTNRAPFVIESGAREAAPAGSEFTIRIDARSAPTLVLEQDDITERRKLEQGEDGAYEARLTLSDSLTARIDLWGTRAEYTLSAATDKPPIAAFASEVQHDERDRAAFDWSVMDDYGVAALDLLITPTPNSGVEPGAPDVIRLELPAIEPREATGDVALDMTRHKWAGLQVQARLRAVDAAGQEGLSSPIEFTLPSRLFLKPLAKAAAEIRLDVLREPEGYRDLSDTIVEVVDGEFVYETEATRLDAAPKGVRLAALKIDALTWDPTSYFRDLTLFMGLRQSHAALSVARTKDEADRVDDLLWSIALRAEYGDYASAAEELARARQALERALRDGASEEEIQRLMQAFRQAVENYLQARIAEALRNGDFTMDDSQMPGGGVQDDDLERMLKAMEELAETGATEQARQLLSDMTDLLERMQQFNFNQGQGDGDPLEGPMAEALRELGEQLLQQRDLSDDTRRSEQSEQGGSQSEMDDLARLQDELADKLDRAIRGGGGGGPSNPQENGEGQADEPGAEAGAPPGMGEDGQTPDDEGDGGGAEGDSGFGGAMESEEFQRQMREARNAQRRAAQALRDGDFDTAMREQERASEALRSAATDLAETADEMNRTANGRRGEAGEPDTSDPLGRPSGQGDAGYGDDVQVPDERERQRARDILNELRRRAEERDLTPEELDYLRRLLDRF